MAKAEIEDRQIVEDIYSIDLTGQSLIEAANILIELANAPNKADEKLEWVSFEKIGAWTDDIYDQDIENSILAIKGTRYETPQEVRRRKQKEIRSKRAKEAAAEKKRKDAEKIKKKKAELAAEADISVEALEKLLKRLKLRDEI